MPPYACAGVLEAVMVREYRTQDLGAVVALFGRSVHELASRDYSPAQVSAWAPEVPDLGAWAVRLASGGVFVSERSSEIAGFARIAEDGYFDLLYVHPDFQRQGVARELIDRTLSWASDRGIHRLSADVSATARPLFERMGFRVVASRRVERRGVWFDNARMERES